MTESLCASVFLSEMDSDNNAARSLLSRMPVRGKCKETSRAPGGVPLWRVCILDQREGKFTETVAGVRCWSVAQWGSTQGCARVRYETPEETPGPLSCGTSKLYIPGSTCPSTGTASASTLFCHLNLMV